uniref:CCHC-type domain-containing protein n=1 Tax=Trichuris muris TaxID=70415 RepID=A0A5S6QR36_TRIMR
MYQQSFTTTLQYIDERLSQLEISQRRDELQTRGSSRRQNGATNERTKRKTSVTCFTCATTGHFARDCPFRRGGHNDESSGSMNGPVMLCDKDQDAPPHNPSILPTVQLRLGGGTVIHALVDTGAAITFVSKAVVKQLDLPWKPGLSGNFRNVNTGTVIPIGLATIEARCLGVDTKLDAAVLERTPFPLTLVINALQELRLSLEFYPGGHRSPSEGKSPHDRGHPNSTEDRGIRPSCIRDHGIVEAQNVAEPGKEWAVPRCLIYKDGAMVPVINYGTEELSWAPDKVISRLSPVDGEGAILEWNDGRPANKEVQDPSNDGEGPDSLQAKVLQKAPGLKGKVAEKEAILGWCRQIIRRRQEYLFLHLETLYTDILRDAWGEINSILLGEKTIPQDQSMRPWSLVVSTKSPPASVLLLEDWFKEVRSWMAQDTSSLATTLVGAASGLSRCSFKKLDHVNRFLSIACSGVANSNGIPSVAIHLKINQPMYDALCVHYAGGSPYLSSLIVASLTQTDCINRMNPVPSWGPGLDEGHWIVKRDIPTEKEVLSQNRKLVVAYISRTLSRAEERYHSIELECLAVVWTLYRFRHYAHGRKFTVVTDNAAVMWLFSSKKSSGKLARWVLASMEFLDDCTFVHRPGRLNETADALSRMAGRIEKNGGNCQDPTERMVCVAAPEAVSKEELGLMQLSDTFAVESQLEEESVELEKDRVAYGEQLNSEQRTETKEAVLCVAACDGVSPEELEISVGRPGTTPHQGVARFWPSNPEQGQRRESDRKNFDWSKESCIATITAKAALGDWISPQSYD